MKQVLLILSILTIAVFVFGAESDVLWEQAFADSGNQKPYAVVETSSNNILTAGNTNSRGAGSYDGWIIMSDYDGDTLWTKTYGGIESDYLYSAIEASDGNYLLGGFTYSYGAGNGDYWLIKTNTSSDTLWTKTYGGSDYDYLYSIIETSDGNYLLGGQTASYGAGNTDYWLVKVDTSGDTIWTKTYGGSSYENMFSVTETSDGKYLLGGYTYSYGAGYTDYWLVKTDMNGNTLWTKSYGGSGSDYLYSIVEASDGNYLLGGFTDSYGAGSNDYWLIKTNTSGDTLWTKTYGGSDYDRLESIVEASDGNYLLGGYSYSYGAGSGDQWLIKTNTTGDTIWTKTFGTANPEYTRDIIETSLGNIVTAGSSHYNSCYNVYNVKTSNTAIIEEEQKMKDKKKTVNSGLAAGYDSRIHFTLPYSSHIDLRVLDITGRTVLSKSGNFAAGSHNVEFTAPNGVYFMTIKTDNEMINDRIVMVE